VNFQNGATVDGLSILFSNPSAGNVQAALSGTATAALLPATTVYNNQANTYSTGIQNFSAVSLEVPAAAAFVATATSTLGIATTAENLHVWLGVDSTIPSIFTPGTWVDGDCGMLSHVGGILAIKDSGVSGCTGSSGLNNVLNYDPITPISNGAAHLVSAASVGSIFHGVTTLAGLAAITVNGTTPFAYVTQAAGTYNCNFTGGSGAYSLVDANVPNMEIAWLEIEAALFSAKAYIPSGNYIVNHPLCIPDSYEGNGNPPGPSPPYEGEFSMKGDGPNNTVIQAGSDFGAGIGLLNCMDPGATYANGFGRYAASNSCAGIAEDFALWDSSGNAYKAVGSAPIAMNGFNWGPRLRTKDIWVGGFNHGWDIVGDHTLFFRDHADGGAVCMYMNAPPPGIAGDLMWEDLRLQGCSQAAIGVDPAANLNGTMMGETYLSAPYEILGYPGCGQPVINDLYIERLMTEETGNSYIADDNGFSNGVYTDANKCRNIQGLTIGKWFPQWNYNNLWTSSGGSAPKQGISITGDFTGGRATAFPSNITAGNLLVASFGGAYATPSLTDTKGNTWTLVSGSLVNNAGDYAAMWYAIANSSGADTVTITGNYPCSLDVAEFQVASGTPTLDGYGTNTNTASTSLTTTTSSASGAADLVISVSNTGPSSFSNPTTGFILRYSDSGYWGFATKLASSSGAQSATVTALSGNMIGIVANFNGSFGTGRGRHAAIDVNDMSMDLQDLELIAGQFAPPPPSSGPYPVATIDANGLSTNESSYDPGRNTKFAGDVYDWILDSGTLPLVQSTGGGFMDLEQQGAWKGRIAPFTAEGNYTTTTLGDLAEYGTSNNLVPAGTTLTAPAAGVIQQPGITNGEWVPIATSGPAAVNIGFPAVTTGSYKKGTGIGRVITTTAAGASGTNGTFTGVVATGGGCLTEPVFQFTVASGAISATAITSHGYGCTSAPTLPTSASSGLTGATLTPIWPGAIATLATDLLHKNQIGFSGSGTTIGGGGSYVYMADLKTGLALGADSNDPATFGSYATFSNCSSSASPAVCGSAAAGSVAIPTGTVSSTLTVNTTAVTANSQIFFVPDDTLGTKLSVTCNSTLATLVGGYAITARTAGTSFQITFNGTIATNPVCGSYSVVN